MSEWVFDGDILSTIGQWWAGRPSGRWFEGNWYADRDGDNYQIKIEPSDKAITVWFSILQDDVEGVGPLMVCGDAAVALKCLLFESGGKYRQRNDLRTLDVPSTPEFVKPDFEILSWSKDRPNVLWEEGESRRGANFWWFGKNVQFSYYGKASFAEIMESILSVDGSPLFSVRS